MILTLKDYAYLTLLVLALVFGAYEYDHLIDEGINREKAAYALAAQRTEAAAEAKIVNLNVQNAADVAKVKSQYAAQHEADVAQSAADAIRLREYDVYRQAHPSVGCAASGPGAASATAGCGSVDEQRIERLELVANELATAGRQTRDALNSCLANRSLLTGK